MYLSKLYIKNFKSIKEQTITLNKDINIFIGNNDAGKTTILEALSIILTGRLHNQPIYQALNISYINNDAKREYLNSLQSNRLGSPPEIIIEAYFDDSFKDSEGQNNHTKENAHGISFKYSFDLQFTNIYKDELKNNSIKNIPTEFYEYSFYKFSGSPIASFRQIPVKISYIDTTQKDYSNTVNRFIANSVSNILSEQEKRNLQHSYRKSRVDWNESKAFETLRNKDFNQANLYKSFSITLKDDEHDQWLQELSINIDDTDFFLLGFGTQNIIKIGLSLLESDNTDIILLEEPENNLSFSNMAKLIAQLKKNENKQMFISTHSSFIINKLNLQNIKLVNNGAVTSFNELNEDTSNYFMKLPGFDTLRLILAEKVILVEGPTDELIIQRAYLDAKKQLPIENGIDIITVRSLAFKRFLDLAKLINKKISVITDNDGDISKNIDKKYEDYQDAIFSFYYDKNELLNTIEPSVMEVNSHTNDEFNKFKEIIAPSGCLSSKIEKKEVIKYMINNKTTWALNVFESEEKINYPEHIKNAIDNI